MGGRDGPPLRGRELRRGHRGVRGAQLRRPRTWIVGDDSRGASRGTRRRTGDHHAHAPCPVALLPPLVRSPRAGARSPCARQRRLQLPAQLGQALPGAGGAGRDARTLRPARHQLRAHRRRDHRDPLGDGAARGHGRGRGRGPRRAGCGRWRAGQEGRGSAASETLRPRARAGRRERAQLPGWRRGRYVCRRRHRCAGGARRLRGDHRARRGAAALAHGRRRGGGWPRSARTARARRSQSTPRRRSPPAASGCGRCSSFSPRAPPVRRGCTRPTATRR